MRRYFKMLQALWATRRDHRSWWKPSSREHAERLPWPEGFGPRQSPVYARNLIRVERPPEQVFGTLLRAEQWPDWYPNAVDVRIHRPPQERFAPGQGARVPSSRVAERVGGGVAPAEPAEAAAEPAAAIPGEGAPPELGPGVEFSWTTFGIRVRSRVTEYTADRSIGWTADAPGVAVYHRWYFRPYGGGTLIVTEECEKGLLVSPIRRWMNRALHAGHQLWLARIRES